MWQWVWPGFISLSLSFQSELSNLTHQLEDLDTKNSSTEKAAKGLRGTVEDLTSQLKEETRAKISASNKLKQLQDELDQLKGQLEEEEEAKDTLQAKLSSTSSQVWAGWREVKGYGSKIIVCVFS